MPEIPHYSHLTIADVSEEAWPQALASFQSWAGFLQPIPGFLALRFGAIRRREGIVRMYLSTNWEYREHLAEWISGPWTPKRILADLAHPAEVVLDEAFEDFL